MKHRHLLIASAALLAMLLAACGDASSDTPAQTTPSTGADDGTAAVTEAYDGPILPESDFGGETFSFYNTNMADWMAINRVTADEETGDTLNDAVFRRNSIVEEKFNVVIEEYQNNTDALKSVMNLITSGDTT